MASVPAGSRQVYTEIIARGKIAIHKSNVAFFKSTWLIPKNVFEGFILINRLAVLFIA